MLYCLKVNKINKVGFIMNILSNFNNKEINFLIYIIFINIISFLLFGVDKFKATKDKWRISEITFIILALFGGSNGILLGMVIFKHKINKIKFSVGIPLIFLLNRILELAILNYLI